MLGLAFQDDAADLDAAVARFISELGELVGAASGERGQVSHAEATPHEPKRLQSRPHPSHASLNQKHSRTRLRRQRQGAGNMAPPGYHGRGGYPKRHHAPGGTGTAGLVPGQTETAAQAEINWLRLYVANLGQGAGFEIAEDSGTP